MAAPSLAPPALAAAALFRATAVAAAPRSFDHGLRLGALGRLLVETFSLRRRAARRVHDGGLEDLVRNQRHDIFVLRGAGAPVLHFLICARGPAICNVMSRAVSLWCFYAFAGGQRSRADRIRRPERARRGRAANFGAGATDTVSRASLPEATSGHG